MVSGHPKSTGISRVDGLSIGSLGFGASQLYHYEDLPFSIPMMKQLCLQNEG